MFLAPQFFWGCAPEFLEWDYKIRPDSDHVAKFQGDRSRELGERVAKKKHLGQNISPSGTAVPGGLINTKIWSSRTLEMWEILQATIACKRDLQYEIPSHIAICLSCVDCRDNLKNRGIIGASEKKQRIGLCRVDRLKLLIEIVGFACQNASM